MTAVNSGCNSCSNRANLIQLLICVSSCAKAMKFVEIAPGCTKMPDQPQHFLSGPNLSEK